MNNQNVPRKKSQKLTDIKIEYSHPYIAELVEICQNIGFMEKLQANFCWRIGFLLFKYLINADIIYITMIAIQTDIVTAEIYSCLRHTPNFING